MVEDNRYGTWNAYGNQYWPAEYLIDAAGQVRHTQFGEGNYDRTEQAVRELLRSAGARRLPPPMSARAQQPSARLATPETYLDSRRAQGFVTPLRAGVQDYPGVHRPALNEFGLLGRWRVSSESATALSAGAAIQARVQAAEVYLVMTSADGVPRQVRVGVDSRPVREADAGRDVHRGTVLVRSQRLYSLVSLPGAQEHGITVQVPPGVGAYAFTFG